MNKLGPGISNRNMPVVTSTEMKEIERAAAEAGLSYYQMMENAGSGAAEYIAESQAVAGKKVIVFCGKGNNGGDGFVVARKLKEEGASVEILLMEGHPKTEDAISNWRICETRGVPIFEFSALERVESIEAANIIVDAIYGTGFHGELREPVKKAAKLINDSKVVTYALDIPSGLNGDDCTADPDTVLADETIVFHRLKPAHIHGGSAGYCGRIVCISIGIEKVIKE
ncbi:MAG: NAD(P)H-hydrate epimerase [Bacillota bacterium]